MRPSRTSGSKPLREVDEIKKKYMEKEVDLEKELDAAMMGLIDKHKPDTFQASNA